MIAFAETMGAEPRWFARPVTKPGYGDLAPIKVELISTMDSPENVAACLNCVLPVCRSSHPACPLRGKRPAVQRRGSRKREGA